MADDILKTISALDPAALTAIVRQDVGDPTFVISDWSVSSLGYVVVLETTGGLYCVRGNGHSGGIFRPWSVILKIVNQPENECQDPQELCYWKREVLAYQSGMLARLPNAIRAPRCYGVSEHAHDAWIWMEHIQETPDSAAWDLANYRQAAEQLGRFAGAYLLGTPLPNDPWLCSSIFRSFLADGEWWAKYTNPLSPRNAWQVPVVQEVYTQSLQARVLQIWAEKGRFITANERLPQVLCHNDAHRRNLMLHNRPNGQTKLTAIDWAFCGPGALGNDLGELVGTSLSYFAVDPAQARELEAEVFAGYLAGLRDAGWTDDGRLARLGYTISLALWWGATLPCEVAIAQPGKSRSNVEAKYGRPVEAILPGWSLLAEFALDRADEARYWMDRLSFI